MEDNYQVSGLFWMRFDRRATKTTAGLAGPGSLRQSPHEQR